MAQVAFDRDYDAFLAELFKITCDLVVTAMRDFEPVATSEAAARAEANCELDGLIAQLEPWPTLDRVAADEPAGTDLSEAFMDLSQHQRNQIHAPHGETERAILQHEWRLMFRIDARKFFAVLRIQVEPEIEGVVFRVCQRRARTPADPGAEAHSPKLTSRSPRWLGLVPARREFLVRHFNRLPAEHRIDIDSFADLERWADRINQRLSRTMRAFLLQMMRSSLRPSVSSASRSNAARSRSGLELAGLSALEIGTTAKPSRSRARRTCSR